MHRADRVDERQWPIASAAKHTRDTPAQPRHRSQREYLWPLAPHRVTGPAMGHWPRTGSRWVTGPAMGHWPRNGANDRPAEQQAYFGASSLKAALLAKLALGFRPVMLRIARGAAATLPNFVSATRNLVMRRWLCAIGLRRFFSGSLFACRLFARRLFACRFFRGRLLWRFFRYCLVGRFGLCRFSRRCFSRRCFGRCCFGRCCFGRLRRLRFRRLRFRRLRVRWCGLGGVFFGGGLFGCRFFRRLPSCCPPCCR
jgi:hypothetical protein